MFQSARGVNQLFGNGIDVETDEKWESFKIRGSITCFLHKIVFTFILINYVILNLSQF